MKKLFLFSLFTIMFSVIGAAQENSQNSVDYNRWSIEGNVGLNKPDDNFTDGYLTSDANTYLSFNGIRHFDLGVRYMFNETFGLKLDGGYDTFKPVDDATSFDFENRMYRIGIQGVVNFRNLFNFNDFTNRFGLLGHFGLQVNRIDPQSRENTDSLNLIEDGEDNGGLMFGLTPQFKLTNRLVLTLDMTFIQNLRQHLTWDGVRAPGSRNLRSSVLNTSVGITYNIGKKEVHADWVNNSLETKHDKDIKDLNKQTSDIEDRLKDDDKDGVSNYVDQEPNTPKGALVNSRGESIDKDGNKIPDNVQKYLDDKYLSKSEAQEYIDVARILADKGYINIFFDFDKSEPLDYSLNAIAIVMEYMKANPQIDAKLVGYADERGTDKYNKNLSEKRAKVVYDILVATGVDSDRLTYSGEGVYKTMAPKNSDREEDVMRISRRVKVQLMK